MNCHTGNSSNCSEFAVAIQRTIVCQQIAYVKAESQEEAEEIIRERMMLDDKTFEQELTILNNPEDSGHHSALDGLGDDIWSWLSSVTELRDKGVPPQIVSIVNRLSH